MPSSLTTTRCGSAPTRWATLAGAPSVEKPAKLSSTITCGTRERVRSRKRISAAWSTAPPSGKAEEDQPARLREQAVDRLAGAARDDQLLCGHARVGRDELRQPRRLRRVVRDRGLELAGRDRVEAVHQNLAGV